MIYCMILIYYIILFFKLFIQLLICFWFLYLVQQYTIVITSFLFNCLFLVSRDFFTTYNFDFNCLFYNFLNYFRFKTLLYLNNIFPYYILKYFYWSKTINYWFEFFLHLKCIIPLTRYLCMLLSEKLVQTNDFV